MKNKKGFTLIELLAIIVILAIIAVITVPIILNIIENSKKGAATDSAYGFKDAVNKAYVTKLSGDSEYEIPNNTYTVDGLKTQIGLSLSGKEPASNSWVTIEKNNVTNGCLQYDEFKVEFTDGKVTNTEKGECEPLTQYGYESLGDTEPIISTSNPTGKNVYLRYDLTDGAVAQGTSPEVCLYSDTYGGELCIKKGDFSTDVQKIHDYFGCDENTWINDTIDNRIWYSDEDKTITCSYSASGYACYDNNVYVRDDHGGFIVAYDYSEGFHCQNDPYGNSCW